MPKFTKGPWRHESPLKIVGADGSPILLIALTHPHYEIDSANTTLIAAAPELLAMLEQWFDFEYGHGVAPSYHAIEALIAKAKGE